MREALRPGDPISLVEAASLVGTSVEAASGALTHLARRGDFKRVRNGLWVRAGGSPDPIRVGARIVEPYAFAYASALELHGVSTAAVASQILVSSERRFATFEFAGVRYRHAQPWWREGLAKVSVGPEFVAATTLERTIVECIRIPTNAGGMAEVSRAMSSLPAFRPAAVLEWVDRYGEANLAARVGFLLEWAVGPRVDRGMLSELERRRPAATLYLDPARRGGTLHQRWNVIAPRHFFEARTPA